MQAVSPPAGSAAAMVDESFGSPGDRAVSSNAQGVTLGRMKGNADEAMGIEKRGIFDMLFGRKWKSSGMLLQTVTGSALVALRERGEPLTCRESLYLLLNEPASGSKAYWLGRILQLCLTVSALSTTYETVGFYVVGTGNSTAAECARAFSFGNPASLLLIFDGDARASTANLKA